MTKWRAPFRHSCLGIRHLDHHIPAQAPSVWQRRQELTVAPLQRLGHASTAQHSSGASKQLIAVQFDPSEDRPELFDVPPRKRRLVRRVLCRTRWPIPPRPVEKRIASPRLAKHGHSIRPQNPPDFPSRALNVQMMQDGIAPDAVKRRVGERQILSVGLHEIDAGALLARSKTRFLKIAT